jgi:hypothetical protein
MKRVLALTFLLGACGAEPALDSDDQALLLPGFVKTPVKLIDLGTLPAGTTVVGGACSDMTGSSSSGQTWAQVVRINADNSLTVLAGAQTNCGTGGSRVTHTAAKTTRTGLRIGCVTGSICSFTPAYLTRFDSNGRVDDVLAAFNAIRDKRPDTNKSGFWKHGTLPRTTDFHNQGMTRLRVGEGQYANWLAMSRNNDAEVVLVGFGSRDSALGAALGPNLVWGYPDSRDYVYTSVKLGTQYGCQVGALWCVGSHAGGIQSSGKYLFVPVESEDGDGKYGYAGESDVFALDVTQPWNAPASIKILDRKIGGATAVGVTKAPVASGGEGFVMVVGDKNSAKLDFYVNRPDRHGFADILAGGNYALDYRWASNTVQTSWGVNNYADATDMSNGDRTWGSYQSLTLVTQTSGDVFLVATHAAVLWGWDWADVYRVTSPLFGAGIATCGKSVCLTKVAARTFSCKNGNEYCSFLGAAGTYINPDANTLSIYSDEYYSSIEDWQTFLEWN